MTLSDAISAGYLLAPALMVILIVYFAWRPEDVNEVWQPKPPKMTSKQKVAYIKRETLREDDEAIQALQSSQWNVRDAIRLIQHRRGQSA